MKQIEDDLATKADQSDLSELEKLIMSRLNDIVAALSSKFADKAETKKAIKLIEKQFKNLYDYVMSKED